VRKHETCGRFNWNICKGVVGCAVHVSLLANLPLFDGLVIEISIINAVSNNIFMPTTFGGDMQLFYAILTGTLLRGTTSKKPCRLFLSVSAIPVENHSPISPFFLPHVRVTSQK